MISIILDYDKCTGCRICEMACSLFHNNQCNPELSGIRIKTKEINGKIYTVPTLCQNCFDAPCVNACPTGATYKDEEGVVRVDEEKCIGCKSCIYYCPFGACYINPDTDKAYRCDLCDGNTSCVNICPKGALFLVDIDKLSVRQKRRKNIY